MGHGSTGLKFSTAICNSSKLSSHSLLKNMSKIPFSNLNKRGFFSNFALCSNGRHFSITRSDTLIFCSALYLEMNFGNLY